MGYYLNNRDALSQYESESKKPFFVDKTTMLEKLIPWVEIGNYHICLTRPRRFGKSVMATMVGAFFGKGCDSSAVFDKLEIAKHPLYRKHRNQSNVCYIDFSKAANASSGYEEFIALIQNRIKTDLVTAYPSVDFSLEGSAYDYLKTVHERTGDTFLFVFDEWDAVFHKSYIDDASRCAFLEFLCLLTKGVSYLSLTYMTGILPIAKYSSGSAMNHVQEYSMISDRRFRTYFGFTEAEVDELFERYRKEAQEDDELTREGLREWYDGYCTSKGERLYNPKSVVNAFENESLQSYWTRTGPFEEISDYILEDVEGIKGCVLLMLAGERIDADIRESTAVFRKFQSRDEILSAMVVYGFLTCQDGKVWIPNKELRLQFADTVKHARKLSSVREMLRMSRELLQYTLEGNAEAVAELVGKIHATDSPRKVYASEAELSAAIKLAYLAAREDYEIVQEEQAGRGYADFIFFPRNGRDDGMILELKMDKSPEAALAQIKRNNYALRFHGKAGEPPKTTGRLILVGISSERNAIGHRCAIEILENWNKE